MRAARSRRLQGDGVITFFPSALEGAGAAFQLSSRPLCLTPGNRFLLASPSQKFAVKGRSFRSYQPGILTGPSP